jgi:hypothetical protein
MKRRGSLDNVETITTKTAVESATNDLESHLDKRLLNLRRSLPGHRRNTVSFGSTPLSLYKSPSVEKPPVSKIFDNESKSKSQHKAGLLSSLPEEVFLNVLSHLTPLDIIAIAQTCKYCHLMASDDTVWKNKLLSFNRPFSILTQYQQQYNWTLKELYIQHCK